MKIKDLDPKKEYQLVVNSQDIQEVKEFMCPPLYLYAERGKKQYEWIEQYDAFFVLIDEGHYKEVYGFFGTVPYLEKELSHNLVE